MTSRPITIPKRVVMVLLGFFYVLAFIITPYWRILDSVAEIFLILGLILFVGMIWLVLSSGDIHISIDSKRWGFLFILLLISILLNIKPLISVIPWRGDEDYFIGNTLALASIISTKWLLVLLTSFFLLIFLAWRKTSWAPLFGAFLLLGIISFLWFKNPLATIKDTIVFRYPYVNYCFFAFLPKLALTLRAEPYYEILYRVIPFIASLGLVSICQIYFLKPEKPFDLLWGCAVATLPLVFYYSSILYLELPAIVLMTLVCFNIQHLFHAHVHQLKQNPFWYGLILIGFIKETTVVFLLVFVFWRFIATLQRNRTASTGTESFTDSLAQESKIALATLLPAGLYLFLRNFQTRNRGFSPEVMDLANLNVLATIGQSFIDQIGAFLILFLIGSLILWRRKEQIVFGFFLSLVLVYPFFFAVDAVGYTGYSRFNLYILPPVLATAGIAITELSDKNRLLGIVLAAALIFVNLWMSPIHGDGTKKPLWGVYRADTAEHYYPYREALEWLKANHENDRILFTGMHYPYLSFAFYFSKLDWQPNHEIVMVENTEEYGTLLSEALAQADAGDFDAVLYQVAGNEIPRMADDHGFIEEKVFKNDAHTLVLYSRSSPATK